MFTWCLKFSNIVLKYTKCAFDMLMVSYLGHVVSAADVAMERRKVHTVDTGPFHRHCAPYVDSWVWRSTTAASSTAMVETLTKLLTK